jgi:hypothetical protein
MIKMSCHFHVMHFCKSMVRPEHHVADLGLQTAWSSINITCVIRTYTLYGIYDRLR